MLKQLITHWKAHRKKPTLLPEETEVHFEETSTVNPIFEDNDSATTSEALGQLSAVIDSFASDLESHDSVATNGNLIDINTEDFPQGFLKPNNKEESVDTITKQSDVVSDSNVKNDVGKLISEQTKGNNSYLHSKAVSNLVRVVKFDTKVLQDPLGSLEKSSSEGKTDSAKEQGEEQLDIEAITRVDEFPSDMIIKVPEPPVITPSSKLNVAKPSSSVEKVERSVDKLPVIAELIKKFQSPSENIEQNAQNPLIVSEKKIDIKKVINASKTEAFKPEKEALSKIFNFPPPPPIEPAKTVVGNSVPLKPNKSFLASVTNAAKNSGPFKHAQTRSDSSLDRNKTVSSEINVEKSSIKTEIIPVRKPEEKAENKLLNNESVVLSGLPTESFVNTVQTSQKLTRAESTPKEKNILKDIIENKSDNDSAPISKLPSESSATKTAQKVTRSDSTSKEKKNLENIIAVKQIKTEKQFADVLPSTSSQNPTSVTQQSSAITQQSPAITQQSTQQPKRFPSYRKESGAPKSSPTPNETPVGFGKKPQDAVASQMEAKSAKSHSEDSGITRGDQISSEATQENNSQSQPHSDKDSLPSNSTKKSKRERKTSHHRTRGCKHCRRSFAGDIPLKRGKCDEYYDNFIGAHKNRGRKHSESWGSDLSWEERELIRKLRSRRTTLRSSIRSGHSQRNKPESGYLQRPHALRRSSSDEGSLFGAPMCSCDECWLHLVKYYAYGRSSLRGYSHREDLCTCRTRHPDLISRKVKFQSDTIPEVSSSERTLTTTPTIPEESEKKEDTSTNSDEKKIEKSVGKSGKNKGKPLDTKVLKEKYRLMTPWEMEEWDLAMRKQLLIERRKRARNMGLMALAMVILIGLIVTGVMIYLRRKTI